MKFKMSAHERLAKAIAMFLRDNGPQEIELASLWLQVKDYVRQAQEEELSMLETRESYSKRDAPIAWMGREMRAQDEFLAALRSDNLQVYVIGNGVRIEVVEREDEVIKVVISNLSAT